MTDAIDELVAHSNNHPGLQDFHNFHRANPEVLDFLVREIRARIEHGFPAFSYGSLWEYARWKIQMEKGPGETFLMNDHAAPFYARAITILHPDFNGRSEFRASKADLLFGTAIEPAPSKRPKNYARRLQWADGTPIERGWRPSLPHVPIRVAALRPDIHAGNRTKPKPERPLRVAAALVLTERDNLANSAPRATLVRLEALAHELQEIEARL